MPQAYRRALYWLKRWVILSFIPLSFMSYCSMPRRLPQNRAAAPCVCLAAAYSVGSCRLANKSLFYGEKSLKVCKSLEWPYYWWKYLNFQTICVICLSASASNLYCLLVVQSYGKIEILLWIFSNFVSFIDYCTWLTEELVCFWRINDHGPYSDVWLMASHTWWKGVVQGGD